MVLDGMGTLCLTVCHVGSHTNAEPKDSLTLVLNFGQFGMSYQ